MKTSLKSSTTFSSRFNRSHESRHREPSPLYFSKDPENLNRDGPDDRIFVSYFVFYACTIFSVTD